jgi:oxygen-independent coproporphyrinogen-3 oxidase
MLQQVFGESPNYSIDLISGLPGVTLSKWIETLEQASKLSPKPTHLSLYDLQIEAGTVFDRWYGEAQEQPPIVSSSATFLPSPSDCAFMYKYAAGYLKHFGYQHYEISSYSLPEYRSRHNQIYWHPGANWYAVGLGATSSVNGARFSRPRAMQDYIDWVQEQKEKTIPDWLVDQHDVNELDRLTDIVMTRLRTSDGLDLDFVEQEYGQAKLDCILHGAQLGLDLGLAHQLLSKDPDKLGMLRLKDPEGFLFSNSIISSIFVELGVEM